MKADAQHTVAIEAQQVAEFAQQVQSAQRLRPAIIASIFAAVGGALLWVAVTLWSGYQISWMAVGVGWIVGVAVRYAGYGVHWHFGLVSVLGTVLGCVLGNILIAVTLMSGASLQVAANLVPHLAVADVALAISESFHRTDIAFYVGALYAGWYYAFRRISDAELARLAR